MVSPQETKMPRRIGKTSGWAAFDHRERRKQQGLEPQSNTEPFPPISGSVAPFDSSWQNFMDSSRTGLEKPFASALVSSANFPSLRDKNNLNDNQLRPMNSCSKQRSEQHEERSVSKDCGKLKEYHPWADESLIEDVMAGAGNDFAKALTLLNAMVFSNQNTEKNEKMKTEEPIIIGESTDISRLESFPLKGFSSNNKQWVDDRDNCAQILREIVRSALVPIEPEWEEDDVYLIHRKEALKMMRSASRHSKAANDAYVRGDHLAAKEFSLKAREEWLAADRLNAKAAKEILSIRNSNNGEWVLDLHGLHAREAVRALQEHLLKIESQVPLDQSALPDGSRGKLCNGHSAPLDSLNHVILDNMANQLPSSRLKSTSLEVITGKGNHSRGQAALPTAIKSFLIENGYHYDESRPGVIVVRPKFRPQCGLMVATPI